MAPRRIWETIADVLYMLGGMPAAYSDSAGEVACEGLCGIISAMCDDGVIDECTCFKLACFMRELTLAKILLNDYPEYEGGLDEEFDYYMYSTSFLYKPYDWEERFTLAHMLSMWE